MKKYGRRILAVGFCFLVIVAVNFALPRMLPGNPVAYLTGMAEEDMTPVQIQYYTHALHLDEGIFSQFWHYLVSLTDGTLGYSFKKDAVVSALIAERLGYTLQLTTPGVILSTLIGLAWGLRCGYHRGSPADRISTVGMIVLNAIPGFLLGLTLILLCCFEHRWLPYTGVNSPPCDGRNRGILDGSGAASVSPGAHIDAEHPALPIPAHAKHGGEDHG